MSIDSAVVLAAGEGQRLRPLTRNRPKPMLSAGTRPILGHVLDALIDAGLTDLHIVVGYNRSRVQNHFGSTYRNRRLTYHTQTKQLGTGHALQQAKEALSGSFVVVNGDELVDSTVVSDVRTAHIKTTAGTLAVRDSTQAAEFGAVRMQDDTVTEIIETPQTGEYRLLNRGVYALDHSIFSAIEATTDDGVIRLTDAIANLLERGETVRGVMSDDEWAAATFPWDLLGVTTYVLYQGDLTQPERRGGIYVHDSATVHADATLISPVAIDADAVIGAQATVGPDTAIGQNTTIKSGAVISDSLIESDVSIGANATIVDSVLAQGAQVGPGVTIPGGRSNVIVEETLYPDRQLGAVIADRTTIGGGTTIAPGTLIGPNAHIAAGSTVRTNVSAQSEVRN